MTASNRTKEFFKDGGVLISSPGGRLSKALAALGVAACVSVLPYPQGTEAPAVQQAARETARTADDVIPARGSWINAPLAAVAQEAAGLAEKAAGLLETHAGWLASRIHVHRFGPYKVPQVVAEEIVRAARDTEFPADTLMAIAEKESTFDVNARPPKGTALGLMQFIEQTWFEVVRDHGAEFGLATEAASISSRTVKGKEVLFVADPAEQERILEMRRDPYLSAVLAVRNLQAAKARIEAKIDMAMSDDDIYIPHFLGTGGASQLLAKSHERPNASARATFPKAAAFNAGMFRGKGGKALTVRQFHEKARAVITERAGKYRDVERQVERVNAAYASSATPATFTFTAELRR